MQGDAVPPRMFHKWIEEEEGEEGEGVGEGEEEGGVGGGRGGRRAMRRRRMGRRRALGGAHTRPLSGSVRGHPVPDTSSA